MSAPLKPALPRTHKPVWFRHPGTIEYQGRAAVVGPRVFALLQLVISAAGASFGEVASAVWGQTAAATPAVKIRVLTRRASKALERVQYPARLGVDRGRVVVYS